MDECREAFEKWGKSYGLDVRRVHKTDGPDGVGYLDKRYPRLDVQTAFEAWQASWQATQEQTIRHAYNAGVAWAIGMPNRMDIDEYLEAQK